MRSGRPWQWRCGVLLLTWLIAGRPIAAAAYVPRLDFGAKFEPVGKVINGAGQQEEYAFATYTEALGVARHPALFMEYIVANTPVADVWEVIPEMQREIEHYPSDVALQLGLHMTSQGVSYAGEVASGVHDASLEAIGQALDAIGRPVFVRIGYEANGYWNGHAASTYVTAFRHVTDILRSKSQRIATVWNVHPIDDLATILNYYPGDAWVDWWSINLFEPHFVQGITVQAFLDEAVLHGKPVMIGESTPAQVGVENGMQSWNDWYALFFDVIRNHPAIKAFCYVNYDWNYIGKLPAWRNGRIQDDAVVAQMYREEMDSGLYQHASASSRNTIQMVTASADGYVKASQPGVTFSDGDQFYSEVGSGDTLRSFVMFDLTQLPQGAISSVQLWLFGKNETSGALFVDVHRTEDDWDETSLTWNQQPAQIGPSLATVKISKRYRSRSVDVTSLVLDAVSNGEPRISFAIDDPDTSDVLFSFHAKDRSDGYPPALQVIFDPDAPPAQVPALPLPAVVLLGLPLLAAARHAIRRRLPSGGTAAGSDLLHEPPGRTDP